MNVIFSREGRNDLDDIYAYLFVRNAEAAGRVEAQILDSARLLHDFPLSGPAGEVSGTRVLVVPRTPYKIIYRVTPAQVVILRVFHGARRWPPEG